MRRPVVLALLAAALVVPVAGCGGDSTAAEPEPPPPPAAPAPPAPPPPPAKPSPTFTKADLERVVLGPKNAPPGLRFVKEESGPMSLIDIYELPRQQREAKRLGVKSAYDAVFAARNFGSDQRVGQRVWLLSSPASASRWLAKSKKDAIGLQFASVSAPKLGDESWAAQGIIQFGGGQAITHAFRLGNTVHTVSMTGEVTPPTEVGALAAAQAALAKARKG